MDTVTGIQILDETVSISLSANNFGKGMKPIIHPIIQVKKRVNIEFKLVKHPSKLTLIWILLVRRSW